MAKGNDGNYLQHSIESALVLVLTAKSEQGRLHVALTHGMAPFELCGKSPQRRRLLHEALRLAEKPAREKEPAVVNAYRATKASLQNFPNTGEIIAALVGRDSVCGGIAETKKTKCVKLKEVWEGFCVSLICDSWRKGIDPGGILASPAELTTPWLFSMDPRSFCESGYADDDRLYKADEERLVGVLRTYCSSGQPGIASIFDYAVGSGPRGGLRSGSSRGMLPVRMR
ncbi:MAG: hypothetical protein NT031_03530 [Planctomycetota bacterium]|nr:hypothetical protein [Planctomycetota bacterium]